MAGADEMAIGGTSTTIAAAAKDAASHNGFADGSSRAGGTGTVTVSVHNPPTSGAYAANANAVEVDVSQTQSTYFMRVLGWKSVPVSTTAVAVILGSGSCVYGLDLTASPAVNVGGTASVNSACGLYVNSIGSGALTVSGGGTITAPVVGVVGGTNVNGGGSTPPTTGISHFGDPLAYIAAPSIGGNPCPGGFHTQNISGPKSAPKHSAGGIHINGGNTVTFSSGLYIMDGGGITIDGGATVSGSGVTFYLTGANGNGNSAANYSGVTINSTATVNLSSPCSSSGGSIAGNAVLFRTAPSPMGTEVRSTAARVPPSAGRFIFRRLRSRTLVVPAPTCSRCWCPIR